MKYYSLLLFAFLFLFGCQKDISSSTETEAEEETVIAPYLPLSTITFDDFSAFQSPSPNWQLVGNVVADFTQKHALETTAGKGVLLNLPDATNKKHLFTQLEHGDLELEMEFLMPKESNSGIYLQSRYEVQLFDSWNKETVTAADCGGIYVQWKDKVGGTQTGGTAPMTNASKAPGLWQKLKILFRAPRFDQAGKKIQNAKFEYVYLNDMLVQKNVEVSSPTIDAAFLDEQPKAPLMIQGDHGPVAFRKLRVKTLAQDSVKLSNLTYQLYTNGKWDYIPDFDTMKVAETGTFNSFADLESLAKTKDHFAMVFEGNMEIPNNGQYLFETTIDDGGDLYIDNQLVVHNEGDPGMGTVRALIDLTKGTHTFKLTYYEEVWLAWLTVQVEGPNVEKHYLLNPPNKFPWADEETTKQIVVTPQDAPEMVRAFLMHQGEKKTHAISIGAASGVHYAYDLQNASILSAWKGKFADVTEMWDGRGESQLLQPLNAKIELDAAIPLATLDAAQAKFPTERHTEFQMLGYTLNAQQFPVFEYQMGKVNVQDEIQVQEKQLQRNLTFNGQEKNLYYRLAVANKINKMPNGWYNIGGNYYLKMAQEKPIQLRQSEGQDELILPVATQAKDVVSYYILW